MDAIGSSYGQAAARSNERGANRTLSGPDGPRSDPLNYGALRDTTRRFGPPMAPDTGPITATSAALVRLLSAGPARVSLDDGALRFEDGRGAAASSTPVGAIDRVETRRSWFWTRLAIREVGGVERAIGGLDRREAERIAEGGPRGRGSRRGDAGPAAHPARLSA